jgi:vitamin K-dependent gamma-carboxylase
MDKFLFKHIDNTGLVLWRVVFGALIALEAFGAITTGWLRRTLVEPQFTFNFIGFDFLQPLPGDGMYYYFILMGIFGLLVMVGYKYRFSMACYALMWTCVYLMQKTSYNNHYYLLMLLCWLMVFLPANRWFSVDAKRNPEVRSLSVPRWTYLVVIFQIWIVYTFAAIAKIYPDWLDGTTTALFMRGKSDYWLIGPFLQLDWVHYCIAYVGIFFDSLIIPLLLYKRTRLVAFIISIFFHLFNSIVFQIGIFPYMSLAFAFFFFSAETLQKRFLPRKPLYTLGEVKIPSYKPVLITVFSVYFIIQIGLPLRHWAFQDDVLWTEEGHRLSWRMMLRSKGARLIVYTQEEGSVEKKPYNYRKLLSSKQERSVKSKPDLLWRLAKEIKKAEAKEGKNVKVFMDVRLKINDGEYHPFIAPNIPISEVEWQHFRHHDWLLDSPEDYHEKPDQKEEK